MRANVDALHLSIFCDAKFIIYNNKKCNSEAKIFSLNRTASAGHMPRQIVDIQTAINPQAPLTTWKDQLCLSLQPGHYSSLTAPQLQPTANQGMYSFGFTILSNTNNTSNYQSTNETHYTQQNTTITTHKGSQLLISTETRYQLQPSDKELHTEHTPLRTIILH